MTAPNPFGAAVIARVLSTFAYDPETGIVTRRSNGRPVGRSKGRYKRVSLDGKTYAVHRIAWLLFYGKPPHGLVDHRDLDTINNRITNLREATRSDNARNCRARSHNTTGYKGVSFDKRCTKRPWRASIAVSSKDLHLGNFATAEEAHLVYAAAAEKHFGEFARAQ